ncbi:MAG: hypothetical protein U0903_11840 [Planctomycetales bacterium]
MSEIRLFTPDEMDWCDAGNVAVLDGNFPAEESRQVLTFQKPQRHARPTSTMELLARTRALHQNRRCRQCDRPAVVPLHRDDAVLNRSRLPIPGTATLVGFRCEYCNHEWRV